MPKNVGRSFAPAIAHEQVWSQKDVCFWPLAAIHFLKFGVIRMSAFEQSGHFDIGVSPESEFNDLGVERQL